MSSMSNLQNNNQNHMINYKEKMMSLCNTPLAKVMGAYIVVAFWPLNKTYANNLASDPEISENIEKHLAIWADIINLGANVINEHMADDVVDIIEVDPRRGFSDRTGFLVFSTIAEMLETLDRTIKDQHDLIVKMDSVFQKLMEIESQEANGKIFNNIIKETKGDNNGQMSFNDLFPNF